jgi:hypothetical protein
MSPWPLALVTLVVLAWLLRLVLPSVSPLSLHRGAKNFSGLSLTVSTTCPSQ